MQEDLQSVILYYDTNVPEYMDGIIRIGMVEATHTDESTVPSSELDFLVNNMEFHSESEMIDYVAKKINCSKDIISVIP